MLKVISASIVTMGFLVYSSMSMADTGAISLGIKLGQSLINDEEIDNFPGVSQDDGAAFGFNAGYSFTPNWAAEFEYVSGGTEVSGPGGSFDIDVVSTSVYAVFRSTGPFYFAGKIGIASVDVSALGEDESETGLSFGLGGGYRLLPNLTLEADYTKVDQDVDWLMLSARYHIQ